VVVRGSHSSWRRQIADVIGCGNAFVSRFEPSAVFYRRGITLKSQTSHKRFFASFARAKCTTKKISIENGHREFAGRCPNFFTRAKLHDSLPSSLDFTDTDNSEALILLLTTDNANDEIEMKYGWGQA
jgi:hypothetical protein